MTPSWSVVSAATAAVLIPDTWRLVRFCTWSVVNETICAVDRTFSASADREAVCVVDMFAI